MKHRLKLKRVVLLELILIMIICMFSGCSKSSKLKKTEKYICIILIKTEQS